MICSHHLPLTNDVNQSYCDILIKQMDLFIFDKIEIYYLYSFIPIAIYIGNTHCAYNEKYSGVKKKNTVPTFQSCCAKIISENFKAHAHLAILQHLGMFSFVFT